MRGARAAGLALAACVLVIAASAGAADGPSLAGSVAVVRIDGTINPAAADHLIRGIERAGEEGAVLLVLELDTPGGLGSSTQDIIQAILSAPLPIVVYVAPQGAWAGSAGTFITLSGTVAAMAPGSSIGAAHPVSVFGGGGGPPQQPGQPEGAPPPIDHGAIKAENLYAAFIESIAEARDRNVEWAEKAVRESVAVTAEEAKELGVVDLVANDRKDLLEQLEGREVEQAGVKSVLELSQAPERFIEMTRLTRILSVLVDPNVAVLLGLAGLLGLYVEFNQPGMIVPGVLGGLCLIMAMFAFQILPFSWIGVALVILGVGLMAAETFVSAYGALFVAGVACLLLGGSMVFDRPDLSDVTVSFWQVLVPAVGGMALFAGAIVIAVGRTLGRAQQSGVHELIGMIGTADGALAPVGKVFVRGEYWQATADRDLPKDARVEIVGVEGLALRVREASGPQHD